MSSARRRRHSTSSRWFQEQNRSLAPLVVMTPRSGWWWCASERGGGLACWLEIMRAMRDAKPARDVLFVASSGHELGHLGIDAFIERRPGLVPAAKAWIHLGANIGAAQGPGNILQASDDEMEAMMAERDDRGRTADRPAPATRRGRRSAKQGMFTAAAGGMSPSSETTTCFTTRSIEGRTRSIWTSSNVLPGVFAAVATSLGRRLTRLAAPRCDTCRRIRSCAARRR